MGYSYTGAVQGVTLKKAGNYKLEVWGAQGGGGTCDGSCSNKCKDNSNTCDNIGGYGAYSFGKFHSTNNSVIYVVVGGKGSVNWRDATNNDTHGGYNGGGGSTGSNGHEGSGGGATHIATRAGLLSTLSSYKSNVLIVAGGGGGAYSGGTDYGKGASAGGYMGENFSTTQATQSSGYAFGEGQLASTGSGGGGGWYGGTARTSNNGRASAGSGYIGNSLLLTDKGMYMYNSGCTASSATTTKTTCTGSTGAHVSNYANTGNGYAKITYLGT